MGTLVAQSSEPDKTCDDGGPRLESAAGTGKEVMVRIEPTPRIRVVEAGYVGFTLLCNKAVCTVRITQTRRLVVSARRGSGPVLIIAGDGLETAARPKS